MRPAGRVGGFLEVWGESQHRPAARTLMFAGRDAPSACKVASPRTARFLESAMAGPSQCQALSPSVRPRVRAAIRRSTFSLGPQAMEWRAQQTGPLPQGALHGLHCLRSSEDCRRSPRPCAPLFPEAPARRLWNHRGAPGLAARAPLLEYPRAGIPATYRRFPASRADGEEIPARRSPRADEDVDSAPPATRSPPAPGPRGARQGHFTRAVDGAERTAPVRPIGASPGYAGAPPAGQTCRREAGMGSV